MTIRAIFYDLDGTLRMNVPNGWRVFTEFADELGVKTGEEERRRAARWEHYYFAESPELHSDRKAFDSGPDFWANYSYRQLTILGASSSLAADLAPQVHQRMIDHYRPADVIPDDLVPTLASLKKQGYILGVLSNREEPYSEYLAGRGLGEYFDVAIPAGEAGVYKPDPAVFHYLLDKAGVSATESMYVGDNYYADVVGARQAGMTPILLDTIGLFTDPDCPVIHTHSQILGLLEGSPKWPGNGN